MTRFDFQMIMSSVSSMLRETRTYLAEHGIAVTGSWRASNDGSTQSVENTFQVVAGKTAAIIGDDGDTGFAHQRVDVFSTAYGDIYAPRGGERAVVIHTESIPIAGFIHGTADGVSDCDHSLLAGERSMRHFNISKDVDVYIKFKNDGKSVGDGLGSLFALVGALLTLQTTSGTTIVMDDATGTVQLGGSGGAASGNATGDAVVRQSDLVALLSAIQSRLDTWASTSLQGGSGVAGPTTLTSITPTASAKTFTA